MVSVFTRGVYPETADGSKDRYPACDLCRIRPFHGEFYREPEELWDEFRSLPRVIGGCIWDFKDQGLLKKDTVSGEEFYAYGGDYGEKLHDGNFNINGIVASDGRPKAAMYECKCIPAGKQCPGRRTVAGHQPAGSRIPVPIYFGDNHTEKRQGSTSQTIARHACRSREGYHFQRSPVSSGEGQGFRIPVTDRFPFARCPAMGAGRLFVASDQFVLRRHAGVKAGTDAPVPETKTEVAASAGTYTVKGEGFRIRFDRKNGALVLYEYRGEEQLSGPLLPHLPGR